MALQHVFVISVGWIFSVVIVQAIGGTREQATGMIQMSMIASGLATILQIGGIGGQVDPLLTRGLLVFVSLD